MKISTQNHAELFTVQTGFIVFRWPSDNIHNGQATSRNCQSLLSRKSHKQSTKSNDKRQRKLKYPMLSTKSWHLKNPSLDEPP
mmetsp:Transcript_1227/g.2445  ORF Transcript_1227/g.2445 Transcript_1227/m.2445 type:complete len:83 (+) Transcript_1227:68-316(+)